MSAFAFIQGGTFPSPLGGQSPTSLPPPRGARTIITAAITAASLVVPAGDVHAQGGTRPYAAVLLEEAYDSNVMNSRGEDLVTRVVPRLGVVHDGRRLHAGIDAAAGLQAYAKDTADDSINVRVASFARAQATRRLEVGVAATYIDADDPRILERPGVVAPLGGLVDVTGGVEMLLRSTRRLELRASGDLRITRFDLAGGPDPIVWDGDEYDVTVGGLYRVTRRLELTARAFGQRFVSYGEGGETGYAVTPAAGMAFRATRHVVLRATGGPVFFLPGDDATWSTELGASWTGRRTRATLVLIRALYGATGTPEALWDESARVVLTHRLGRWVTGRLLAEIGRSGVAPAGASDVSMVLGGAELGYVAYSGAMRIDVFAERRQQDQEGGIAFDQDRTVVGVRLVAPYGAGLDALVEAP